MANLKARNPGVYWCLRGAADFADNYSDKRDPRHEYHGFADHDAYLRALGAYVDGYNAAAMDAHLRAQRKGA